MRTVFDLDDLCDQFDPYDDLEALAKRVPGFKVTLFAIPMLCSDELISKYEAAPWAELALHGFHHSSVECFDWSRDEAKAKIVEAKERIPGATGFKAPGWVGNRGLYDALAELGMWSMDHPEYSRLWRETQNRRHIMNVPNGVTTIHGHTWETMGNGPSWWSEQFDTTSTPVFAFVSEVAQDYTPFSFDGDVPIYRHWAELALTPDDVFLDLGAYKGEGIGPCVEAGVEIHSFEPHPEHYEKLLERWSGTDGVTLINKAAGTGNGVAKLYEPREGAYKSGASLLLAKESSDPESFHEVGVCDIADYIESMKRKPTILKINTEGTEWEILGHLHGRGLLAGLRQIWIDDHARAIRDPRWMRHREKVFRALANDEIQLRGWV